jgi:hypothetical protein
MTKYFQRVQGCALVADKQAGFAGGNIENQPLNNAVSERLFF